MTVQINETAMSAHTDSARYEPHGFCARTCYWHQVAFVYIIFPVIDRSKRKELQYGTY